MDWQAQYDAHIAKAARKAERELLLRLFEDHYWDSLDKQVALAHVKSVFAMSAAVD